MRKLILILLGIALIAAAKMVHGQSTKVKAWQNYNWNHPTFSKGDTVINIRTYYVYIIDSPMWRKNKRQTFYGAHDINGTPAPWLPENSIVKWPIKKN